MYIEFSPKGTVPGQPSAVSWGTILQLYHKPKSNYYYLRHHYNLGYSYVDYTEMIYLLLEAIKQL